jgi:hypothetical protein
MPGRANPAGRVADYHRGSESAPMILFSQAAAFLYGSAHKYPGQPIAIQKSLCDGVQSRERPARHPAKLADLPKRLSIPSDSASDFYLGGCSEQNAPFQQLAEFHSRHRPAEVEPLALRTVVFLKKFKLFGCFHPFGHNWHM